MFIQFLSVAQSLNWKERLDAIYPIERSHPDSAIQLYKNYYLDAHSENSLIYAYKAQLYTGIVYSDLGKYDSSEMYYNKALNLSESINHLSGIASSNTNLGNLSLFQGNYAKAIDHYLTSAKIFEQLKDSSKLSTTYMNVYSLFKDLNDQKKADKYLELGNKVANSNFNKSYFVVNKINDRIDEMDFEEIPDLLEQLQGFIDKTKDKRLEFYFHRAKGEQFRLQNEHRLAIQSYLLAEKAILEINDPIFLADLYRVMSISYLETNQFNACKLNADKGMSIAQEIQSNDLISGLYKIYADLENRKNPSKAYQDLYKASSISDSLKNSEYLKQVAFFEEQFETLKKDKELIQKQREIDLVQLKNIKSKNQNTILWLSSFFLVMIIALLFRQISKQRKLKQQEILLLEQKKEKEILKAILKGEETEKKRIAQDLHDGVNSDLTVIKYCLQSIKQDELSEKPQSYIHKATEQLDLTIDNIRYISHNLSASSIIDLGLVKSVAFFCESVNIKEKIDIHFQCYGDPTVLKQESETSIYRIIQELTINALKHAEGTEIVVQLNYNSNQLFITIEDDGKGMDEKELLKQGLGLKNVHSRIEMLGANIEMQSSKSGTSFEVIIPIEGNVV